MTGRLLFTHARLVDPASGRDALGSIALADGRIVALGDVTDFHADRTVDASGLVVCPGLVDLCARLGEPGREHAGMLESELAAAVSPAWSARPAPTRCSTSPASSRCSSSEPGRSTPRASTRSAR